MATQTSSFLSHDMTPRDPYQPSARIRRSMSVQDVPLRDNRLRHITTYEAAYSSQIDLKRGTLGINQALDGRSITSAAATPLRKDTMTRSMSDNFYFGGFSSHQQPKDPKKRRALDYMLVDMNNPEASDKRTKERLELAYYERIQREEREALQRHFKDQRLSDAQRMQWPFASQTPRTEAQNRVNPEKMEKIHQQKSYAQELDEQVRLNNAEKIRQQYVDVILTKTTAAETPFTASNKPSPRKISKTAEEMSRTPSPEKMERYSRELEYQIRERELLRMQEKATYDPSTIQTVEPFGRPGAGAPLVDPNSGEAKAHLKRQFMKDQIDYNQLHQRDEPDVLESRVEYKQELDRQMAVKEEVKQQEKAMSRQVNRDSMNTNGVTLPLSPRKASSVNSWHAIPVTDVVPRPPNGGRMIKVHQPSPSDYDENAGMAFGRPGAGAPVLHPVDTDEIDPHLTGIHKPTRVARNPVSHSGVNSVVSTRPATKANSRNDPTVTNITSRQEATNLARARSVSEPPSRRATRLSTSLQTTTTQADNNAVMSVPASRHEQRVIQNPMQSLPEHHSRSVSDTPYPATVYTPPTFLNIDSKSLVNLTTYSMSFGRPFGYVDGWTAAAIPGQPAQFNVVDHPVAQSQPNASVPQTRRQSVDPLVPAANNYAAAVSGPSQPQTRASSRPKTQIMSTTTKIADTKPATRAQTRPASKAQDRPMTKQHTEGYANRSRVATRGNISSSTNESSSASVVANSIQTTTSPSTVSVPFQTQRPVSVVPPSFGTPMMAPVMIPVMNTTSVMTSPQMVTYTPFYAPAPPSTSGSGYSIPIQRNSYILPNKP